MCPFGQPDRLAQAIAGSHNPVGWGSLLTDDSTGNFLPCDPDQSIATGMEFKVC